MEPARKAPCNSWQDHLVGGLSGYAFGVHSAAPEAPGPRQVKSRVTPWGNIKAAHSVNHRGLPGGGELGV